MVPSESEATEEDQEREQILMRYARLKTTLDKSHKLLEKAARAVGTAVTTNESCYTAVAGKSAHAGFTRDVAASSSNEDHEDSKSWKKCLVAEATAPLSRKMEKTLEAPKHEATAVAVRAAEKR